MADGSASRKYQTHVAVENRMSDRSDNLSWAGDLQLRD